MISRTINTGVLQPPPATAEAPSPLLHGPNQGRGWHPYGLLMLLPFPPSATIAQGHRPSTIAAHCRRPPWLGHLGPPRVDPLRGIGSSRLTPSFPLTPRPHPRPELSVGPPPANPFPLLCSMPMGGGRKGHLAQNPLPFPIFSKGTSHLLTILLKKPLLLLYFQTDPPTL